MTLPANTVTARMQTLLREATSDSKEQILRDYLEYVPKEVAFIKKMQAQGIQAVALLKQTQQTLEGSFVKFVEGQKRNGSELAVLTDALKAILKRAEKLPPDDFGDLEDAIILPSFRIENALYSERIKKMQKALDNVIELFAEYDASEGGEMAIQLKRLERKVKAAKDLLDK